MEAKDSVGFEQYWQIVKRRWRPALGTFGLVAITISILGFIRPSVYEAVGKLRFKGQDTTSAFTGLEDQRGQLESLDDQENPILTEIGLMRTVPVIRETLETVDLRDKKGEPISIKAFMEDLDITHEQGTDLLRVAYRSTDIEAAERTVNTLITVYLEQHLLENRAEASAAREFIEGQLPNAEGRALEAEAALRDFKERNGIIALEEETSSTVALLGEVTGSITDVTSEYIDVEAQLDSLSRRIGRDPQSAFLATAISQSEGVQQLLQTYQEVESLLAAERVRFHDQHPVISDLENRLRNLEVLLGDHIAQVAGSQAIPADLNLQVGEVEAALVGDYVRLEAQLNGLKEHVNNLQAVRAAYSERAGLLPRLEQEQHELERRLEAAQSTYSQLLQRLQEVRVVENQNVGNVRIAQSAETLPEPVAPSKSFYILAGLVLGGLLGTVVALLLEARDHSIKTVGDARESFGFPIIGVVPLFDQPKLLALRKVAEQGIPELVVSQNNTSLASESFHMLRNNLKFLDSDHPPKVIVITSSVPDEGKSTVASNLATAIAQTSQRVLLVDTDLLRPTQHRIWDLPGLYGLSNLLIEQVDLQQVMLSGGPNLTLLPGGSRPPNPISLLDSKKMRTLLDNFRAQFDYVILDAPSLSSGASTSILGKMADGLLLVVRPKVADRNSVNYSKELLSRSQQNVLGVVVNGALPEYEPHSYFLSKEFYEAIPKPVREDNEIADIKNTDLKKENLEEAEIKVRSRR